ncbi:MAG: hypothetical protein C5B44_05660 [Acidobacteria bacterium]|nr:MAG: hypothetical protein C5B44_05660 [Acidobacteriota bacterium]
MSAHVHRFEVNAYDASGFQVEGREFDGLDAANRCASQLTVTHEDYLASVLDRSTGHSFFYEDGIVVDHCRS